MYLSDQVQNQTFYLIHSPTYHDCYGPIQFSPQPNETLFNLIVDMLYVRVLSSTKQYLIALNIFFLIVRGVKSFPQLGVCRAFSPWTPNTCRARIRSGAFGLPTYFRYARTETELG